MRVTLERSERLNSWVAIISHSPKDGANPALSRPDHFQDFGPSLRDKGNARGERGIDCRVSGLDGAAGDTPTGADNGSGDLDKQDPGRMRPGRELMKSTLLLGIAATVWALFLPPALFGQAPPSAPDSSDLVDEARERQEDFERFRESRIPVAANTRRGGCDERIGRICIWFGGEGETDFPGEPPETALARTDLIRELAATNRIIRDPWVVGQLVHYLSESGSLGQAERVSRECDLVEPWWCSALLGYVLHLDRRYVEAEAAFRTAAAGVPYEEEERWLTPRFIFTNDGMDDFEGADLENQAQLWELFWRFSDPLFMREGNDRLTEHYARLVVALNREEAGNPYTMSWGEDLEESLIRYGRQIGWSRVIRAPVGLVGAAGDPRSTVGHHHPNSRGYLFPEEFLEAPAEIGPESWITTPREARSWYAAPYAPDFRGLETQVARFRRGDEMLVVGAYRPSPPERDPFANVVSRPEEQRRNPFASRSGFGQPGPPLAAVTPPTGVEGPVKAGFFLAPESGGDVVSTEGTEQEGVFTLRAPTGRYVSSLEVFEPEAQRAWRARQGVSQEPMIRGLVALSDLMVLREGAPLPADLEEAVPLARPNVRIGADERFTVAWEVYGLGVDQAVQVTLGFTQGRPGFLARVGDFLGIVEPEQPVEISFSDAGSGEVETLFRAVALQLPDLEPGDYTLHLRLDLPGREPSINSRPIIVTP